MKNKREISLEEYFLKNKSQYKGSSTLETIKEIIKNYKKDLKIKKSAKAVIIINKIEDIFKNLDFNWINKIENKEATYVNEGNVINDLVVFYKKNKQLFDNYSQDKKENIQKILNEWEYFKDKVYKTIIPRNVRLGEAPSFGLPINLYDPKCVGAVAYSELAQEMIDNEMEAI